MKLAYGSSRIEKLCSSPKKARVKLGSEAADELSYRLQQLESAVTLQDISQLGRRPYGPHLHWLKGNKSGLLSVDVTEKLRLVFRPEDTTQKEFDQIVSVIIISVGDTHK